MLISLSPPAGSHFRLPIHLAALLLTGTFTSLSWTFIHWLRRRSTRTIGRAGAQQIRLLPFHIQLLRITPSLARDTSLEPLLHLAYDPTGFFQVTDSSQILTERQTRSMATTQLRYLQVFHTSSERCNDSPYLRGCF